MAKAAVLHAAAGIAALRIVSGLAWLESAFVGKDAKFSSEFLSGYALVQRVHDTFVPHALTPGVAHVLTTVVLPHATFFAVLIAVGDAFAGVSLTLGIFTGLGATVAVLRAATNLAVAAGTGADTIGYNVLLAAVALVCLVTRAGRFAGFDAILARR